MYPYIHVPIYTYISIHIYTFTYIYTYIIKSISVYTYRVHPAPLPTAHSAGVGRFYSILYYKLHSKSSVLGSEARRSPSTVAGIILFYV